MERSVSRMFLPIILAFLLAGPSLVCFLQSPEELIELEVVKETQLNVETTVSITGSPNGSSDSLQVEVPEDEAVTGMDLSLEPHIYPVSDSISWSSATDWNMSGVINDGVDFNTSSGMTLLPQGYDWDFESNSFGNGWTHSGNSNWIIQSGTRLSGQYTAQSGSISHNQQTSISVTISNMVGSGSFKYRTSTEGYYDRLLFCVDNTGCTRYGGYQAQWSGSTSGTYNFNVNSGSHTYTWKYYKDGSVNSGYDRVWIDDVEFNPTSGGSGDANWTSAKFGPAATGLLKTPEGQYGLMSIDASTSGSSSVIWDILDGTTKQPINGFKDRSDLYADLGAIDWQDHPTIRLKLHMDQPSGTSVVVHSVNLQGRYAQTFTRNPGWSGSINWDGDSYYGSGTILSPAFESLRPISRVKTTASYSGSGQLLVSADDGPFNSVSTSGGTHSFDSYANKIQFKWEGTSSNSDFRSVILDLDSGGLPIDPRIDVGMDGLREWEISDSKIGPWGWQDRLSTGSLSNDFIFTTTSSKQVGIWLPTSGLDVMRFSVNPSSAGIQNLVISLDVGGTDVFSHSFGTFSDSQIVTFNPTSLSNLNNQLASSSSIIWPTSQKQVGDSYVQAVFTLDADYGEVNIGGISAVYHPIVNLSYHEYDEMIWSINDLMPSTTASGGIKKIPLSIQMTNTGSIKATIKDLTSTDELSSDSMSITNATITLAPSYQWIEVNTTHTAPVGTVSAIQLDMIGSLHQVRVLCRQDGSLSPVNNINQSSGSQDQMNMLLWDGSNGCSLDVNGTSVTSTLRFQLNSSWDDEDNLAMRVRLVLTDGRRSVPLVQEFGPGSILAVENDVEIVSWEMYNDLGIPIPEDRLYLKSNTPITISVNLGFPNVDSFLAPRAGDVAVRVFENDEVVANSTSLVNGSIDINLVAPLSSQPIEYRIDLFSLHGQENISQITLNRTYEIDSLAPIVIDQNIRKYDHLEHSLSQEIRVEIYDRPMLPDHISLMIWRDWNDDSNFDGMPNATEFIEYQMISPSNIEQARANYTFYFDDTDAPNGGIVAGYISGSDAAGNSLMGGGGPGLDEQLFTYQLAQDGAPNIIGTGGFSDGPHSWLHPATLYEVSIPFDEPNGLSDLEDVRFQLASNSIVDPLEVVWNATTNRCISEAEEKPWMQNNLLVESCHIYAREGEINPFTTELELRMEFTLDWALPIENDLRRAPAITVRDRAGFESWLELPQLRWRFSPNLAISGDSVIFEVEQGSIIDQSAWVRPGTGLNISGQVKFIETGISPTIPFDVSILLDGERTLVSTVNGYFNAQLNAPMESKSHALSFELSGLPAEAVDGTDSTETLYWIEVDSNQPIPVGVVAPREGTEITLNDLSSVQVELLLSEQEKLNVDTLQLFFKVSTANQQNGPALIEGSEPLIVSGSPVGQSISVSSVIDIESRLPSDAYQDELLLSVWVKGTDMAGNGISSSAQFNSGSTPFMVWNIEHLVAQIDLTKLSYSRSGEIDVGQTTMVTIELRNTGHAPGSVKLLAYEMGRGDENRSLTPVPISVVVPMGERVTYDIDWIPENNGERWVIVALEDGSSIEGEHINILGEGGEDPLGSALQDVPLTWLLVIAVLLLILTLVVSLALRSGGSSESVLDDTDDWDDDWEEETKSTYASPSDAMSALESSNQESYIQEAQSNTIEYQYQNQQMEQNQYYQQNNQNQWTEEQIQAYQQQHNQYYGGGQQ